jgi:hypothetical protein
MDKFPNLKSLTLHQLLCHSRRERRLLDLTVCPQLSILDLEATLEAGDFLKLPESITILRLKSMAYPSDLPNALDCLMQPTASIHLPKLKELALSAPGYLGTWVEILLGKTEGGQVIASSSEEMSKLSSLTMDGSDLHGEALGPTLDDVRLRNLEQLSLARTDCDDDVIPDIIERLPKLRMLDLTETPVTGVGVKQALKAKNLEQLVLNDCRDLGVDAVEWARLQGVTVKYKMKGEARGGWKVRL